MLLAIFSPLLCGFLLCGGMALRGLNKKLCGWIAASSCLMSFFSLLFFCLRRGFRSTTVDPTGGGEGFLPTGSELGSELGSEFGSNLGSFPWSVPWSFPWFQAGDLSIHFSFVLDPLSLLMALLVTGAGSLIHIYSIAYMSGDRSYARYFAFLNLFVFMMLVLVFAGNLPLLFAGWEGVGLCSYLLIGFWHEKEKSRRAALTAFITNRLGDMGFLLGCFLLFAEFQSLEFLKLNQLFAGAGDSLSPSQFSYAQWAGALLFAGAVGKSAQIPLYFWLIRAMAGPSPVSALIHAATMVTAGVYLLLRMSDFYAIFPLLLQGIGLLGALGALWAGGLACAQWDIKKILAYSTISQLAYLFSAIGVKAWGAAFFHLFSHGFFKALLFLCAGSIISAFRGEQDIRRMRGGGFLRNSQPLLFWTWMAGALALAAIPPFSGFFSKDEILQALFASEHYGLFSLTLLASICTAFYVTKLSFMLFFNSSSSSVSSKVGELSGRTSIDPSASKTSTNKVTHKGWAYRWTLNLPLVTLALLSLFVGFLGIPHLLSALLPFHPPHIFHQLLSDTLPLKDFKSSTVQELLVLGLSLGATATGAALYFLFRSFKALSHKASSKTSFLEEGLFIPYLADHFIPSFFVHFTDKLFRQIELAFFQKFFISLKRQLFKLSEAFSRLQDGNIQSYGFYFSVGLSLALLLIFLR